MSTYMRPGRGATSERQPKAIAKTCEQAGADDLTLIGYCFAGVLVLLAAAGQTELPIRNLVKLTTTADDTEMGFMSKMFLAGRLDPEDVIDDTGLVPSTVMDEGFQALKPTDWVVQQVKPLDASDLRLQSGHVGLVAGRHAAKVARPAMAEWIRRHSDGRLKQANPDSDGLAPAGRGLAGQERHSPTDRHFVGARCAK